MSARPDADTWAICTLTASGPIGALEIFLQEAEGPGFLDWRAARRAMAPRAESIRSV